MIGPKVRLVAGCMSGTSLDGLDVVMVELRGSGLDLKAAFKGMVHRPLGQLRGELMQLAEGMALAPSRQLQVARRLGQLHVEAVTALVGQGRRPDFVVAHGQTIWHAPQEQLSFQLFDPWPLVRELGLPVCFDLRQADLIGGGEGAPITPLADWVMYRQHAPSVLVVNLGGICNVTRLVGSEGPQAVEAADIGPCNLLIDGVVRLFCPDLPYDEGGRMAASGSPSDLMAAPVMAHPFFEGEGPKSAGREQFGQSWVRELLETHGKTMDRNDLIAAAVEVVAMIIGARVRQDPVQMVILAGGGARNLALLERIRVHVQEEAKVLAGFGRHRKETGNRQSAIGSPQVCLSDELGVPAEAREAMAMAVLGTLSQDGLPITLAQVTGAADPGRAGTWVYP